MTLSYIKVFLDWDKATRALKDAEKGRLIDALIMHAKGEQDAEANLSGNERFVFPIFQSQIDRDNEEYSRFIDKQRSNGAKGGRPKKPSGLEENLKNPLVFLETQKSQDKDKEEEKDKENSNNNYNSACVREDDAFLSDFDDIEVYYRQNINYSPKQRETQAISQWLSQTCKEGVMYAIDEAVDKGALNKSYISAVVDNLERNNVKTQADLTQYIERRKRRIKGGAEHGIAGTDVQEDGGDFDFSQVFKQPWERDDWEDG